MSDPSPELARAQRIIVAVIVTVAALSVVAAVINAWPVSVVSAWLGGSLRARFAAAFAVLGGALLVVLLVALVIKKLVVR